MDLGGFKIMQYAQLRMEHAAQRQRVLAQNVANLDTPNYRPKDVRELDFEKELRRTQEPIEMAQTNASHLSGTRPAQDVFRNESPRKTFEESPDGNQVILEEQMQKVGSARGEYTRALRLMSKHMQMLQIAIGRGGS